MKAFIVRPFGKKSDIDFENVHNYLIAPALAKLDIQGGTTLPFMQAGNIRADMFQQLLVADLVIADISIHNANVFYELGIRHALQPKRTFLLRAKSKKDPKDRTPQDEVPFDLSTDRYLQYDSDNPAGALSSLIEGLRQTIANEDRDSPVFRMLPDLKEQDRAHFLPVPQAFRDDVELAFKARRRGLLGLLAMEAREFFWAAEGLRIIGRAQFDLRAFHDAEKTWNELYKLNPTEPEANQRLGTIYQRLGNLDASDQALQRVLSSKSATRSERAEAQSLIARNIKDRWRSAWITEAPDKAPAVALKSPDLLKAYQKYRQAFQYNLDSFYPGLNALSMLTIYLELAKRLPDVWENRFDTEAQAKLELDTLELERQNLSGAVGLSLEAAKQVLIQNSLEDRWLDISLADHLFLISTRPQKVSFAYQSALEGAPDFYFDSARAQLEIFRSLGIKTDMVDAVLSVFRPKLAPGAPPTPPPARVILFTGHMIDERERITPRFPNTDVVKSRAREAIRAKVQQEVERTVGTVIGIASGASGSDLLFHDVCEELKVKHDLLLPLPPDTFRNESVSPAGVYWEGQFDNLLKKFPNAPYLAKNPELPIWLSARQAYTAWQRANLWLIQEALSIDAQQFTLLAVWDGIDTEGIGGTAHMRTVAQQAGAALVTVYTSDFAKPDAAKTASSTTTG